MLARLDRIEGVEGSRANRAGTLVRVSVAAAADPNRVAEEVGERLAEEGRSPARLTGDCLRQALAQEEWYGPEELLAVEFRTLAVRRVRTFAESEKLDQETADKLVRIAEEECDRLAKGADTARPKPAGGGTGWDARRAEFASAFLDRAQDLLTAPQVERLRQMRDRLLGGQPAKPAKE